MSNFRKNTFGSVSLFFASILFVIVLISGLAIDSTMMNRQHSRLQDATDAAVVSASSALARGDTWAVAQKLAKSVFSNAMENVGTLALARNGEFNVAGKAEMPWSRGFTLLITGKELKIHVESGATQEREPTNIVYLVDVSTSMGIGATKADIDRLNSVIGCAIACHFTRSTQALRDMNIVMRIDVARDAILKSLSLVESSNKAGTPVNVAIVLFSNTIVGQFDFSDDFSAARTFARNIDITNQYGQGGTNLHLVVDHVRAMIHAQDPGAKSKSFAVWLTDGVENTRQRFGYEDREDPAIPTNAPFVDFQASAKASAFAIDLCDDIKSDGVQVMVLHTPYVTEDVGGSAYKVAQTLSPIMVERMMMCASKPEFLRNASAPEDIVAAAVEITKVALSQGARIIN